MYDRPVQSALELEKAIKNFTPSRSLDEYCAAPFLIMFLETRGLYMEIPFRNTKILGHSMEDDEGISTMINSNIGDLQRKFFTQAHELGHHILDPDLLRNNLTLDFLSDDSLEMNVNYGAEHRANRFAAHLLLPNDVLNVLMIEEVSRKLIKRKQKISYQTLSYRLMSYLIEVFEFPPYLARFMSENYISAPPGKTRNTLLNKFWQDISLARFANNDSLRSSSAIDVALKYFNMELHNYENNPTFKTRFEIGPAT